MKAIAKKPEARFASCGDFAQALEEAMQGTPPPPKPPSGNLPWSGAESGQQYASPSPVAQSVSPVSGTPIAPPKVQTPPPAHVAAAPPRFVTSFEAGVKFEDGREASLAVGNMSRAGCFLVSDFLPPIFSRVTLTMPSAGELPAEVVRHVPQEQATAWNMPAGFAVQFWEVKPEQREALEALTHGKPLAPAAPKPKVSRADDAVAERTLGELRKRIQGDHYVVLSLGNDCEVPAVRTRGRELERQLLALKDRALSDGQLLQVEAALVRIREAIDILGTVQKRAEFDGLRFNWRGVGMCLAAGLRVPELDEPRRRFLAANPGTEARVQLHMLTADGFEKSGALTDALRVVEQILNIDPLNWELHNRRKLLLRRLSGSNSGAFPRA